jgi:hypothetical protein
VVHVPAAEGLDAELNACAAAGRQLDLSAGTDASQMSTWGPERTIHAETLRRLLAGPDAAVEPCGVRLRMVVVDGSFDLTGVELRCPVEFDTCRFDSDDPIGLSMATAPSLVMRNCKLPGVSARTITVNKGPDLSGSTISGVLDLSRADISGGLTCEDTNIEGVNKENFSFAGRGLKVAGGAIDIVVPIVNVHQADEWAVNGRTSWGWVWVGGTWVATGLGWALATLFVAGYTGLVRSD